MLKRINWTRVFYLFAWLISLGGLVVLMSFIGVKKNEAKCNDIKVIIPGIESFIDRDEVDAIITKTAGALIGRNLNAVDIHKLENALKANPYIQSAKVYADMNGVITVYVEQREPVLRILNVAGMDFYVDRAGLKMPVSANFTPHVLVANGFILEGFTGKVDTLQTRLAKGLYQTALFIKKDTLWNDQMEQLFVNDYREIELVPRVGNHKIVLGSADSLETKFKNLLVFYKKAMPHVGWNAYKTINIKYTNQIVCVKSGVDSALVVRAPQAQKPAADTVDIINQDTLTTATH